MFASQKRSGMSRLVLLAEIAIFALVMLFTLSASAGGGGAVKPWYTGFTPILLLLGAIIVVVWRLPKPKEEYPGQLAHLRDNLYRFRRGLNWLILGAIYAFLYWGRYNLNPAIEAIGGKQMVEDFNWVFGAGTAVYGVSFLINGPLTNRYGGRLAILVGAIGATIANLLMGLVCFYGLNGVISKESLFWYLIFLYSINMYFQSFGAVAIVKCNSTWFHVRERGVFGAVFGILIALGLYFAFDWTYGILYGLKLPVPWAFIAPAIALLAMLIPGYFIIKDYPHEAGYLDINTGDATAGESGPPDKAMAVFKMMFQNKVIMMIACIEFCSGFLRQSIMQLYRLFAKETGSTDLFVYKNWGMVLCVAGILGGVFAGTLSDHLFNSRRGPVAAVLYIGMLLGGIGMCFLLGRPELLGWVVVFMSLCIIGVHGMLSGTASMDFAGSKNAGIAVGLIDGFVYGGTALQAILYANTLPEGGEIAKDSANWWFWPVAMVPMALIGLILSYMIRNEKPQPKVT